MRNPLSKKVTELEPSGIRKFFDIVNEMKDAISLGVGEPDFDTPWRIREEGIYSLERGRTFYTSNAGLKDLKEEIVKYLERKIHVSYDPADVLVTVGGSEAIDMAFRAMLDEGDEVLVPQPSYVSYVPCVQLAGGTPVSVRCVQENGFILTPEALEAAITPRTKAVLLPYPNNPTGGIMTRAQLEALVPVIQKHDLLVISDEIYAELTYGGRHVSVASLPGMFERTVVINGFSKAFAMTGWRIGFVCAPPELDAAMLKIHQYTLLCAPAAAQYAAVEALKDGFGDNFAVVEAMRDEYDKRRLFMVDFFNRTGLPCFEPRGAFYVYPSVRELGVTGEEFATGLLRAEKVAAVPGDAFGEAGKYHIRCSYATSMANLDEATERIARYVRQIRG